MNALEIREGDVLQVDGKVIYHVIRDPVRIGDMMEVYVRYEVDGGTDIRCFDVDQDVPLTRP